MSNSPLPDPTISQCLATLRLSRYIANEGCPLSTVPGGTYQPNGLDPKVESAGEFPADS